MKWIEYFKRTSITQIHADWSEYIGLCRECLVMHACRRVARDKITAVVNSEKKTTTKLSCIRHEYFVIPCFGARTSDNDTIIHVTYYVCGIFDKTDGRAKCAKSDCPCIERNHEYIDVCERYNVMRQACRDFWRVKFEQANQNVK